MLCFYLCIYQVCWLRTRLTFSSCFFANLAYTRQLQLMCQNFIISSSRTFVWRRCRKRCDIAARRYWIRPGRTCSSWDNFVSNVVPSEELKESFRMSGCVKCGQLATPTTGHTCKWPGVATYMYNWPHLERKFSNVRCGQLQLFLELQSTVMREPLVNCQVALTLYYLADEGRMRKTANSFGLFRSSVSVVVRRVSRVISQHLGPQLICLPVTKAEVKSKVKKFSD